MNSPAKMESSPFIIAAEPHQSEATTPSAADLPAALPLQLAILRQRVAELTDAARELGAVLDGHPATVTTLHPVTYCIGGGEILKVIERPDNSQTRKLLRTTNTKYDGPIVFVAGGSPWVNRTKLIEWWNSLETILRERAQQRRDARATTAEQLPFGRTATILPGVAGHIDERRAASKKRKKCA